LNKKNKENFLKYSLPQAFAFFLTLEIKCFFFVSQKHALMLFQITFEKDYTWEYELKEILFFFVESDVQLG
jgi:hypothetical protein